MDTPKDICNKYCKERIQRLTENKPCPFNLISSEIEEIDSELQIRTVCEGTIEHPFKTVIDRISRVSKTGVKIIKEVIKHVKEMTYGQETTIDNDFFKGIKIGPTQVPYTPPFLPGTTQGPWVSTTSINGIRYDADNKTGTKHDI